MKVDDATNREIEHDLARSHSPSLWVVKLVQLICAAGFLAGLYFIVTDYDSPVGYLTGGVSVLMYTRVVMGYRYWRLVQWVKDKRRVSV